MSRQRTMRALGAGLLVAGLGAAEGYVLPRHQTRVREEAQQIRSVYADLRANHRWFASPWLPDQLGVVRTELWTQPMHLREETGDEERRQYRLDLVSEWRVLDWLGLSAEAGVQYRDDSDKLSLQNPRMGLILIPASWRTGGVRFDGGVIIPAGTDDGLGDGPGSDGEPGIYLGMTATDSWNFWTGKIALGVDGYRDGVVVIREGILLENGEVLEGRYQHDRLAGDAALRLGYSLSAHLSVGLAGRVAYEQYESDEIAEGSLDPELLDVSRLRLEGLFDVTFKPNRYWEASLAAGIDADAADEYDDLTEGLIGGGWFSIRY